MPALDPISVILVTAGSRGEALLFRYPFCPDNDVAFDETEDEIKSSYDSEKGSPTKSRSSSFVKKECLNYSDRTLANILTPHVKLCGKKFELRVDDVLFVGHPTLLTSEAQSQRNDSQSKVEGITVKLFNIVFALQADVELSVCECYHDLSKKLSIALKHEELRCGYFSRERKTMLTIHDEVSELPEANEVSPFHLILPKSTLAKDLCHAFDSVSKTGTVSLKINNWIGVGFCLPHKVHNISSEMIVNPEAVQACLAAMRPYHTILLLVDESSLTSLLPDDCSPDLIRFIKMATPLKSFQTLSQDADIPLSLIFSIAAHLVYWGKARIIYPLCESNVYVVSPVASIRLNAPIAEPFCQEYPGMSLHEHLAQFSLPTPLGEQANPLWLPQQKNEQVQRVIWMLKHQLLIQDKVSQVCIRFCTEVNQTKAEKLKKRSFTLPGLLCSTRLTLDLLQVCLSNTSLKRLHMYIYLMPIAQNDSFQDTSFYLENEGDISDESKVHHEDHSFHFDSQNLAELSELEKQSILQLHAAGNPEDIKLFTRLCRYFRGNHHFEEIMYYENLRRNQLLTLLEKFRGVLFICQHEDPATVYHTMTG